MNWKLMTLATTSLVALGISAAPASAAGQMMGDVTLGYGWNWETFNEGGESDFDLEYPTLLGSGHVNLPYSNTVNVQLDVVGRASMDDTFYNGGESDETSSVGDFALGGHINYRDSQGMLGVFASSGRVDDTFVVRNDVPASAPVYMAGFEGQYFCNEWTLRAQLAYMDSDESTLLSNAGAIRIGATYYASKPWKIVADLAYIDGELGFTSADVEQWAWRAGVHHWFGKSIPVSGFVEYRGRAADIDGSDGEVDQHTLNLGVTFHFGGNDFQDADRNGASADLPDLDWYRLTGDIYREI